MFTSKTICQFHYSTPVVEQCAAISLSLSVCLSVWTDLHKIVQIPCGHGSVLLWQRCDTLCTFGFMDDITFGCSESYGDV